MAGMSQNSTGGISLAHTCLREKTPLHVQNELIIAVGFSFQLISCFQFHVSQHCFSFILIFTNVEFFAAESADNDELFPRYRLHTALTGV